MRKTNSLKAFFTMCLLCVVGTLGAWAQSSTTKFVFNTKEGLKELKIDVPTQDRTATNLSNKKIKKDKIEITCTKGTSDARIYNANGQLDLRVYKRGGSLTFSTEEGYQITSIQFEGTNLSSFESEGFAKNEWTGKAQSVTLTASNTVQIKTATVTFAAKAEIDAPTITEGTKTFDEPFTTTITATEGAKIYYTLNGETPTNKSTEYTGAIEIPAKTTTLKAIFEKDGKTSEVAEATYTFKVQKPVIEVASKRFNEEFTTSITASNGADIYYTLDGSNPTTESTNYTSPITISQTTTLKAIAVKYGQSSEVAEAIYTYSETKVGDGSFENPYSPEEVLAKSEQLKGKEIWVKGKLLGVASKSGNGFQNITSSSTTIAIGESGLDKSIAISLGSQGTTLRNYFTQDNKPAEITGKDFIFYGKCSSNKYFGRSIGIENNCYAFAGTETNPIATLEVKTDEGYATFVSKYPFYVPEGVECGIITEADNTTLNINYKYKEGFETSNIVPANYPVLVKTNCGKKTYNLVIGGNRKGSSAGTNLLQAGTGKVFTADADHLYYKLAYDDYDTRTDLGFYWGAANGGAFFVPEGSAYLAVPKSVAASVKSFRLEDATTGITAPIAAEGQTVKTVYTIDGRRVQNADHLPKGLYIVNGKKVMIK